MLSRKKSYERMMRIEDLNHNVSVDRNGHHIPVASTNARRLNVIGNKR